MSSLYWLVDYHDKKSRKKNRRSTAPVKRRGRRKASNPTFVKKATPEATQPQ